jgi:hypothetical protein
MKKVVIFTERNPKKESREYKQYPSILFYLGSLIQMCNIINPDSVEFVYLDDDKVPESEEYNDLRYFSSRTDADVTTKHIDKVIEDSDEYDIAIGMILVGRKDHQYEQIDKVLSKCSHFIYFDGDTEPLLKARKSLFSMMSNLPNVREKLRHVFITEGSSVAQGLWGSQYEVPESFIPYVLHPYYYSNYHETDEYEKYLGVVPRSYTFASFKTLGKSGGFMERASEEGCKIILEGNTCRCISPSEIHRSLVDSKVLLGTISLNVHENCYRSASKIIESLHAGCLPTVIDIDDSLLENRYPYYRSIPRELKVLRKPSLMRGSDLDDVVKLVEEGTTEIASDLYQKVFEYHHPQRWKSEMMRVVEIILKEDK